MSGQTSTPSINNSQPDPDDSQLLHQAGQLAGNLRDRFREVERREQQISEQLLAVENEHRRVRMLRQDFNDESASRDITLKQREQQFAEQLAEGQRLLVDLQTREEQLEIERVDVESQRADLRKEMERALEVERSTLQHSQGIVEAERRELAKQVERRHEEHQDALRQIRRELETERRRLRAQMAGDIDTERSAVQREREQWQHQKELEQSELSKQREARKLASDRFEQELAEETERSRNELDGTRRQVEAELFERRGKFDGEYKQWTERTEFERAEIATQQAELETGQEQLNEAYDNQQQQYRKVFENLQDEHQRSLDNQKDEFERELHRRKEAFADEHNNHQRRLNEESLQHQNRLEEQRQEFQAQVKLQVAQLAQARQETEQELAKAKAELASGTATQQAELEQQLLEIERSAIHHESDLVERQKLQDAESQAARADAMQQLRDSWDKEREQLRTDLASDIDAERTRLADEIEKFTVLQQRETITLKRAKEAQEIALNQARSELVREKQQRQQSLEQQQTTQEAHLNAARCQFEEKLQKRVDEFENRIEAEDLRVSEVQAAHEQSVSETAEMLANERSALNQDRTEWIAKRDALQATLEQQQQDFQVEQHVYYVQRQQWQNSVQQTGTSLELRKRQLHRYREILTERERSLAREQELFEKARGQSLSEFATDREQLNLMREQIEGEHKAFHGECDVLRGDMQRERERLKQRSDRLDEMRHELQETSLRNLESRLAAEEVMAELIATAGEDVARDRVAEVRTVIAGQIHEIQGAATSEQKTAQLVAVAQRELEDETTRLKSEQEAFSELVNVRERNLKAEEQRLQQLSHNWERREHQWRTMRDDWLKEKLNAEQIIRSLLDEISDGIESPVVA